MSEFKSIAEFKLESQPDCIHPGLVDSFAACCYRYDSGYGVSCISSECKLAQYYISSSESNSSETNGHTINISKKSEIKLLEQDPLPIPLSLSTFDDHASQASTSQTWTSSFHPQNPNLILTGSDDCSIKLFDVRSGFDPVYSERRFDNCLYKFDFRNLSSFLEHHRFKTPIWYLDFVTSEDGTLESLHVSGCHDGSALYDTSGTF
uniref:WD domain, G-beta repeat n=1 Tax=Theileria annulata TaxID=5874 RepID=A0A3B0MP61_THEAN